jgi:2-dehydropantoate 2-reductase
LTQKSILIAGTGAVATLFAAQMGSAGYQVKMLGFWPEAVQAIRKNGVKLIDDAGHDKTARVDIFSDPIEIGQVDYALVLIKSWQTRKYARLINQCLSPEGYALTLQNGLGNQEILAEELGAQRCMSGVMVFGSSIFQPGVVKLSGEPVIQLEKNTHLDELVGIFKKCGFQVEEFDNLVSLRWGKLIINSGINPLSTILGVLNGKLGNNLHCRSILADLANEGEKTAIAFGIRLPYIDPLTAMEEVIHNTARNTSSMLQDLQRGAPTEIDAINGAIVRHAHRMGIPVPVNECLVSLIKAMTEMRNGSTISIER